MEILLYGLDDAGRPQFARKLVLEDRPRLREIATQLLASHDTVEVWEGPTCVLRLRRRPA